MIRQGGCRLLYPFTCMKMLMRLNLEAIHNYRLPMDYIHCKTNDDTPRNYKPQNIMHQFIAKLSAITKKVHSWLTDFLIASLFAGTDGMLPEDKGRIIVVNALCLLTVLLAALLGTLLFWVSHDFGVLVAAWTEAAVFLGVLWLNKKHRHLLAAFSFVLLHNIAVMYFGIWRQMTKEEELLTVFLCVTSVLIFKPLWQTVIAWLFSLFIIAAAYAFTRSGLIIGEPLTAPGLYSNLGLMAILIMTFFAIVLSKYYDLRLHALLIQRSFIIHKYNRQLEDYTRQLADYNRQLEREVVERTNNVTRYVNTIMHEVRDRTSSQHLASEAVFTWLKYSEVASKFESINDPSRLKALFRDLSGKFGTIHRISRGIKAMIDSTLDIHKIGEGRYFELRITDVELRTWAAQVTEMMQFIADKHSVTILLDFDKSLPEYVRTDDNLLSCAVRNLLNNAISFTPSNGNISLTVCAAKQTRELFIEVEDQGPGIEREKISEIFKPYYTQRNGGTGLGLALGKFIAEELGGRIEVTSIIGKGSIFRIIVPLIPGEKRPEVAEKKFEIKDKLRILIVDDNEVNRSLFSAAVRKLGCVAITANDAKSCIDKVIQERPDLLLLDVMMNGMSGIEALRIIRSMPDPVLSHIPVILNTGNAIDQLSEELGDLKADAFLLKPFEHTQFIECMNVALDRAKSRLQSNSAT